MADEGSPYAVRVRPREVLTPGAEPPRPFGRTGTTVFLAAAYRRSQINLLAPSLTGEATPSHRPPASRPVLTRLASISSMESTGFPLTPLTPPDVGTPRMLPFGSPPSAGSAGGSGRRYWLSGGSGRAGCGAAGAGTAPAHPPTIVVTVSPPTEPKGLEWLGALLGGGGRARVEPMPADESVKEMVDRAAVTLQRAARGWRTRATITRFMEDNYAGWEKLVDEPQVLLNRALEHAERQLARDPETGGLLPLNMPLDHFSMFGPAVTAYMRFVYRAAHLFFLCFLLAIANVIANLEGSDLGSYANIFSSTSLGNVDVLRHSAAVVEMVISGTLVYFLFWARGRQLAERRTIHAELLTPADFSVMISGLPPQCTDATTLASYLTSLDPDVLHDLVAVTLSFDYRDLIQCMQGREQLRIVENSLRAKRFLLRREVRFLQRALGEVPSGFLPLRRQPSDHKAPDRRRDSPPSLHASASNPHDGAHALLPPPRGRLFSDWRLRGSSARAAASSEAAKRAELARHARALERVEAKVRDARESVQRQDERMRRLVRGTKYVCTGFAFATFNTELAAKRCLEVLNDQATLHSTTLAARGLMRTAPPGTTGARLRAERPPEPEEVYWDQLEFKMPELIRRQLGASALLMLVALAGTVVISFANYGMGPVMSSAESLLARIGMQFGFTLLIILGNIFIFILAPILASNVERHYTFGGKELSVFGKMLGFQVFNTVVASTVFYFFRDMYAMDELQSRHSWYVYGSGMVLNVLIGDTFAINLGIDLIQPGLLYARHVAAPAANTQREMNAILSPKADIYLAFRLQLVAKLVVICLIYSSALPISYLLTACFMWLAMWIDRYNLLRRFAPPPRSPDFLIAVMLTYILPAAILLHLGCTVLFYEQERAVMRSDPLCDAFAGNPNAPMAFSAGSVTGPASAGDWFKTVSKFQEADGQVLSAGPPAAVRCQTAATLAQADAAVATAWMAAFGWGAAVLAYCVREATRVHDTGVHVTELNLIAKFADVFTVQQPVDRQVLVEAHSNPFRRTDDSTLYMPPLPRWVLAELGSDAPSACHASTSVQRTRRRTGRAAPFRGGRAEAARTELV